jgi:hypothetical protein
VDRYDAHNHTSPHIAYVGNGHIGLSVSPNSELNIKSRRCPLHPLPLPNTPRTLSVPVQYKPLVALSLEGEGDEEAGQVTDYVKGTVTTVQCLAERGSIEEPVTVTSAVLAHRTVPGVLVQDIRVHNPTARAVQLAVERLGIAQWESAKSLTRVIEHGDGGQKYSIVTGTVEAGGRRLVVAVVSKKLSAGLEVKARMTQSLRLLTGVAYSGPVGPGEEAAARERAEREAIQAVTAAAGITWQKLLDSHTGVWAGLWTSGFGISWSFAEGAINGDRINATMYYVLSQSPTPLHSGHTSEGQRSELRGFLSYTEGCYSGIRTLQATNLWTPLTSLTRVDTVVSYWLLNLEKNGCHNLIRAGADGVMQAMVLSLPGLKFSNHHLELNVHPRELHRDVTVRRVNYGNETHVNISVNVMGDNRAALFVSLDKMNRDYYACDAGCLDPPVRLGPTVQQFPVKLTEPVTAILYITADHEHMQDLKHVIHVKEAAEAPAHEQHVLELHRTGARIGGLHPVFWIFLALIIVFFHLFLFRLIYNEYCGAPADKYRIR